MKYDNLIILIDFNFYCETIYIMEFHPKMNGNKKKTN